MHLFAETFQKALLVLDSDGFQGRGRKEVSETVLKGVRKRFDGVYLSPDTTQPKIPGMPRDGAKTETVHWTCQKSTGRKEVW
jgi:hypothetical protein